VSGTNPDRSDPFLGFGYSGRKSRGSEGAADLELVRDDLLPIGGNFEVVSVDPELMYAVFEDAIRTLSPPTFAASLHHPEAIMPTSSRVRRGQPSEDHLES
jgi:hypothetical protein